jgi:hypothetical protein
MLSLRQRVAVVNLVPSNKQTALWANSNSYQTRRLKCVRG